MIGCNCDACGDCNRPNFLQASASESDYTVFQAWTPAERRAQLGRIYSCSAGGEATEEFDIFVLAQMDADQDGNISQVEFDDAVAPLDLGAWPKERRCAPAPARAAALAVGAALPETSSAKAPVAPHAFEVGLPSDADGAAFLQAPASSEL